MSQKRYFQCLFSSILILVLVAISPVTAATNKAKKADSSEVRIFLVAERHAEPAIVQKELELWQNFYNQGMRHLFIESGYCSTQLLNKWMHEENDEILMMIYDNIEGTLAHAQCTLDFYHSIKTNMPETIFHGIDVEHQYKTTGLIYLEQLRAEGLENSEEYKLSTENFTQGSNYYSFDSDSYREECMTQNFIREFDSLPDGEKIMAIFGGAHIITDKNYLSGKNMTCQLESHYKKTLGKIFSKTDLRNIHSDRPSLGTETFIIKGKTYTASYFGEQNISSWSKNYDSRKFWRIENCGSDFDNYHRTFEWLPESNYPTAIQKGDVFRIEYTKKDGTKEIKYYRSDGKVDKKYGQLTHFIFGE